MKTKIRDIIVYNKPMKKSFILLITSSLFLSSCSIFNKEKIEQLNIAIAPIAIPSEILESSESFKENLRAYLYDEGYDVAKINVEVYDTHEETRLSVVDGNADIAYLPVLQYLKVINDVDYMASITKPQLDMGLEVNAYNDISSSTKPINDLAYRNALIYTGPSEYGNELYEKFKNNTGITWIDINVATWCHVVVTSLDGYVMPSLWLIDEYNRRMGELFDHTLEVRGYEDVVKSLANQSCDIAVGPSLLRYDYEDLWTTEDFGGVNNIFDDVHVIGVTQPIYDDVFVSRVIAEEDDPLSLEIMTLIQTFLVEYANENPELYHVLGFKGIEVLDKATYETMIPAYEYVERIMS